MGLANVGALASATRLRDLAPVYAGFIVDLWGVIHDGIAPYEGVISCLEALKSSHKPVIFLSNAPRKKTVISQNLTALNIPSDLYDDILTSGEETYRHLKDRPDSWYAALGNRCFHLGLAFKIKNLCADLDLLYVDKIEEADFILNTGLDLEDGSLHPFQAEFKRAIERGIPMICANPDKIVIHGKQKIFPAGYLASYYEKLGGFVRYHGKPDGGIYTEVQKLFRSSSQPLLAIGDSLLTDIKGARNAGIDSALVTRGVHAQELAILKDEPPRLVKLEQLYRKYEVKPIYILSSFQW